MNVKCCLFKHQIANSDLHNTMFKHYKVILDRSGAHMIDDIAFKYESNLPRC